MSALIFRILPEETIRVLELESGGVDFLQNAFSPDILPRFVKNKRLVIRKRLGTNFTYIGFNLSDPILSKLEVRRAIAHAIDRRPIVRFIHKGLVQEADSLLPPDHWAHKKGLPNYAHRPELAMKLLDAAGYPDPDGPGPEPRFTLVYKTSQNELGRRIATVFGHQLARVGIKMKIRSYEWGTFFGDIRNGNFQLYSLTWVGISDPDIYRYIFHSRFTPPAGLNRGRYQNARVDALLEEAQQSADTNIRARAYGEAQRILGRELPYINLWHSMNVAVFDRRISGYRVYPDADFISLARATPPLPGGGTINEKIPLQTHSAPHPRPVGGDDARLHRHPGAAGRPGGPDAGRNRPAPPSANNCERRWGWDRPIGVQYADYMGGLLRGDLGNSLHQKRAVSAIIFERTYASAELTLASMAVALLISLPLGIAAARRQGTLARPGGRFSRRGGREHARFLARAAAHHRLPPSGWAGSPSRAGRGLSASSSPP